MTALRPSAPEYKASPSMVLTYELPYEAWSTTATQPAPNLIVPLDAEALGAKLGALELYRSQLKTLKGPVSLRGAERLARYRGLLCGADAAEGFHLKRLVV
jgi:hypothetical protein